MPPRPIKAPFDSSPAPSLGAISDKSWQRIEERWGKKIGPPFRSEIWRATSEMLGLVSMEQNAERWVDTRNVLREIAKAEGELYNLVSARPKLPGHEWALTLLDNRLDNPRLGKVAPGSFPLQNLKGILLSLDKACQAALQRPDVALAGNRMGEAREGWIQRLYELLAGDASARPTRGDKARLAAVIKEFEEHHLPRSLIPKSHSDAALAKAVARALSQVRRPPK